MYCAPLEFSSCKKCKYSGILAIVALDILCSLYSFMTVTSFSIILLIIDKIKRLKGFIDKNYLERIKTRVEKGYYQYKYVVYDRYYTAEKERE